MHSSWKECPVFANRSCPFKDAKSPDEITQILEQLPASHTDQSRPTHAVLIETLALFNRDLVMEGYSFSAILGKLVSEHTANQSTSTSTSTAASTSASTAGEDCPDVEEEHSSASSSSSSASSSSSSSSVAGHEQHQLQPHEQNNSVPAVLDVTDPNSKDQSQQQLLQLQHQLQRHQELKLQQGGRLAEALKSGTEEAHKEAESVHFVKNFIRGKIDRRMYALFVAQMFHVYRRLESALDEHAPEHFADCHFPKELNRLEALREDIDFWQGNNTTTTTVDADPPISPATQDYLERIDAVAKDRPILLLAHAYTRYLGDLSGGKILARVAKKALNLDKGPDGLTEGLAFYDFPLLRGSVKAFKDKYRQALNDLQFEDTDEAVRAIVQEANVAFLLNMRLFEELDVESSVPGASVRPLDQVYSHVEAMAKTMREHSSPEGQHQQDHEQQQLQSPAPCPFLAMSKGQQAQDHNHQPTAPCPFANMSGAPAFKHQRDNNNGNDTFRKQKQEQKHETSSEHGSCPWPFILLHDPNTGMRQWQTWLTIGLVLAFVYQQYANLEVL